MLALLLRLSGHSLDFDFSCGAVFLMCCASAGVTILLGVVGRRHLERLCRHLSAVSYAWVLAVLTPVVAVGAPLPDFDVSTLTYARMVDPLR